MTTSRQETILATIHQLALGTNGVSGRVYRSRQEAFSRAATPAMVIEPLSNAPAPRRAGVTTMPHQLELQVLILVDAPIPDQAADPIRVDFHSRLMADLTLGGVAMDIEPGLTRWDQEVNGIAVVSSLYVVAYRTLVKSLTSA